MIRVNEIFASIQGESSYSGLPFVFIRLTGCNLRCTYCDTKYAYDQGTDMSIDEIIEKVKSTGLFRITVTGGEPLIQEDTTTLLRKLCDLRFFVMLETNGNTSIDNVDKRVRIVMDVKTPGSGMVEQNNLNNINHLDASDEIKFVIVDRADYDWAKDIITKHQLEGKFKILFSAAHKKLDLVQLADWILADKLNVKLQLQIHKYIWGDVPSH